MKTKTAGRLNTAITVSPTEHRRTMGTSSISIETRSFTSYRRRFAVRRHSDPPLLNQVFGPYCNVKAGQPNIDTSVHRETGVL
jgi:hypothetical protein